MTLTIMLFLINLGGCLTRPENIKPVSCSSQLRLKFIPLIHICWHFVIYIDLVLVICNWNFNLFVLFSSYEQF